MKPVCGHLILIFCLLLGVVDPARAEQVGDFRLVDIFLEPTFVFSEERVGRFEAGNSFASMSWVRDATISANFKIGTRSLVGRPDRYAAPTLPEPRPEEPALIEAYGQAESAYGRIRFGAVPVPFGLEGGESEARLRFPRALFYRRGMLPLRDYGVGYHVDNAGFVSDWTVHNGEAGTDIDNQIWFTARWAYHSGSDFQIGFSGSAGRTTPTSSGRAADTKNRIGNFFIGWERESFSFEFEGEIGETLEGNVSEKFRAFHGDAEFQMPWNLKLLTRFDLFEPDTNQGGDLTHESTVGLAYRGRYETSVLYLLVSKVFEEGISPDNHVARLVWRLTPTANPHRF